MDFLPKDVPQRLMECEDRIREAIEDEDRGLAIVALAKTLACVLTPACRTAEELAAQCKAASELFLQRATDNFDALNQAGMLDHQLEAKYGSFDA